MKNDKRPIAWIVHPRSFMDIEKGMPYLKILPSFLKLNILPHIRPYKASSFSVDEQLRGYVIAVPLLPEHFQKNQELTIKRLDQAFRLAKELGAEKVSVGGMITSVSEKNGFDKKYGVTVYDGTELVAQIAAQKIFHMVGSHQEIMSIGIIGATTKVGSHLSKYLAKANIKELHLFAKTEENVRNLVSKCEADTSTVKIFGRTNFESLDHCDVVVLSAFISDAGADIVSRLKTGSIFMSIIEPTSPFVDKIHELRPDVKLKRGINIKAPSLSYDNLSFLIDSGNTFSCLAEALVADNGAVTHDPKTIEDTMRANNFQIS